MFGFCSHKWLVPKNGYQTCEKCGKVNFVGHECIWEIISEYGIFSSYNDELKGTAYTLKCKICGNLKQFNAR